MSTINMKSNKKQSGESGSKDILKEKKGTAERKAGEMKIFLERNPIPKEFLRK